MVRRLKKRAVTRRRRKTRARSHSTAPKFLAVLTNGADIVFLKHGKTVGAIKDAQRFNTKDEAAAAVRAAMKKNRRLSLAKVLPT